MRVFFSARVPTIACLCAFVFLCCGRQFDRSSRGASFFRKRSVSKATSVATSDDAHGEGEGSEGTRRGKTKKLKSLMSEFSSLLVLPPSCVVLSSLPVFTKELVLSPRLVAPHLASFQRLKNESSQASVVPYEIQGVRRRA